MGLGFDFGDAGDEAPRGRDAAFVHGHRFGDQFEDDFGGGVARGESFEDEGGGLDLECFDVVGFGDDIGGGYAGGLSGDFGGGVEPVRRGDGGGGGVEFGEQFDAAERVGAQECVGGVDLGRGDVGAGQFDGLAGAGGEVAAFGGFDGFLFGAYFGGDGVEQGVVVDVVQGASDAVGGFDDAAVGDEQSFVGGQVGAAQSGFDFFEVPAFFGAAPCFAVGDVGVARGAGRVGVGAPLEPREGGEVRRQIGCLVLGHLRGQGGHRLGEVASSGRPGGDEGGAVGIECVSGHWASLVDRRRMRSVNCFARVRLCGVSPGRAGRMGA
ncbi:hypothetical protein NG2371_07162 [Nocardia gamkensis]|nr:hypothetical protein [Nocardia gamkensis]